MGWSACGPVRPRWRVRPQSVPPAPVAALTVLTGTIMAALDASIVNVALPSMSGTLGVTVEIKIDAYPGLTFHGKVESISLSTGAQFSLLPPRTRPAILPRWCSGSRCGSGFPGTTRPPSCGRG